MRLAILGLSLVLFTSCAGLDASLGTAGLGASLGTAALDCTEKTATDELCGTTTAALSSPAASWESTLGSIAKGAVLDEVGCLVQAVALGQLPASGGCTPSAASPPSPAISTPAGTSATPASIHIVDSHLARPVADPQALLSGGSPGVSEATIRSRARTWLRKMCPGGHCQPAPPASVR